MGTQSAGQDGIILMGNAAGADLWAVSVWNYNPSSYNQQLTANYKMQGKCSIDGWDSWVNNTGDESGRTIHGTQEAGTVIATWYIPQ